METGGVMGGVSGYEYAILGLILLIIGLAGVVLRRNIIFLLISIEIAINGVFLLFFGASLKVGYISQAIVLVLMAVAAAEAAVGLALAISIFRIAKTVNIDELSEMKQ